MIIVSSLTRDPMKCWLIAALQWKYTYVGWLYSQYSDSCPSNLRMWPTEYSGKLLLLVYSHIHIVRTYDSIFQSKFLLSLFHTYRLYDHDYQFAPYREELEPDVNRDNKVIFMLTMSQKLAYLLYILYYHVYPSFSVYKLVSTSLSEHHTSGTARCAGVYMFVCGQI